MEDVLICEETVPDYFIVYSPMAKNPNANVPTRRVKPVATIEKSCGKWLWRMRDESAIGLCETKGEAKDAVRSEIGGGLAPEREAEFIPPTADEAREYAVSFCRSRHIPSSIFDAEAFIEYHDAGEWMTAKGKRRMKDWKNAVRHWVLREAGQ